MKKFKMVKFDHARRQRVNIIISNVVVIRIHIQNKIVIMTYLTLNLLAFWPNVIYWGGGSNVPPLMFQQIRALFNQK